MVGKKSTLRDLRLLLQQRGVRVVRTTEFFQGRTSRWALAWSHCIPEAVGMAAISRGTQGAQEQKRQQQQQQAPVALPRSKGSFQLRRAAEEITSSSEWKAPQGSDGL